MPSPIEPNPSDPQINGMNVDGTTSTNSDAAGEQSSLANATTDLTNAVDEMLKQLTDKFTKVGEEMVGKSMYSLHSLMGACVRGVACLLHCNIEASVSVCDD